MVKKSIKYTASLAVLATMMQAGPVFAAPSGQVTQKQIDATQSNINDFETKMQKLDNQISIAMEKSQKLNDSIKAQQEKIKATTAEIEKAKEDLDAHKQVYSERLKSMQLEGQQPVVAYAEILFSSTNISEFLTRFSAISDILQSDTDLLNGLKDKEQALKDAQDRLHNELAELQQSQAELAAEKQTIEEKKQEVAKELASAKDLLANQKDQMAKQVAEEKARIAREREAARQRALAAQRASAARTLQHTTSSASDRTAQVSAPAADGNTVDRLISYAEQFLGVPYVWGGSTPSGFDCSGFTSYVFRSVGVNLPRVSRDQQDVGTRISPYDVQPGDLVFRGNPAYHVGIYIGGGKFIHAPQTGDVVKIANYNPGSFTTAARVLH